MKSKSHSLPNEINCYEFVLYLIILYDILFEINIVSKNLQLVSQLI